MIRQIFSEVLKTRGLHPNNIAKNSHKEWSTRRGMWKGPVPTARFVLYQLCTNCSRRFCTTDYTPDKTSCSQKTREGFGDPTKRWTIWRRTDLDLQKCREWGVKMWVATLDLMKAFESISHNSLWNALKQCGIEPQYVCLLKRLHAKQKATVLTDKENDVFEINRKTKQGDTVQFTLQHSSPSGAE